MISDLEIKILPHQTQYLFKLIGFLDGYTLLKEFGGQDIYIPQNPNRSKLIKFISSQSLTQLSNIYGGTYISVPTTKKIDTCARNNLVINDLKNGYSRAIIAKKFNLSVRQVTNIKRKYFSYI